MSLLKAAPFNLKYTDKVVTRISASNLVGSSKYSPSSEFFALIQSEPFAPSTVATRGNLTTTSQIHVVIEALAGLSTGGATIYSYQVDISIDGATWIELKGYTTNDVSLEHIETGLTISTPYKLRFRAKNIHGWGNYSQVSTIETIMVPSRVSEPNTELIGTNVRFSWSAPDSRGSPILSYTVLI